MGSVLLERQLKVVAAAVVMCLGAGACTTSADTTQIASSEYTPNEAAPTTSIVRSSPSSSTTTSTQAPSPAATAVPATSTLESLVARFAADPALLGQLQALEGLQLDDLAGLVGADPTALAGLGLSVPQIEQLAASVLSAAPVVQQDLTSGSADPTALLGVLLGSFDLETATSGAVGALVQTLLASITGLQLVVSPQLTVDLGELLGELDPDGLGQVAADPANAALLALATSVILSANPLLAEQLLTNPLLDPSLAPLLAQLQDLSRTIGDAALSALINALDELFPGLIPRVG